MTMTQDERLALLVAMDKQLSPALREAKAEARDRLLEACAADGTDRRAIRVGGQKVGEVGVSYAKGAPVILGGAEEEAIAYLRQLGLTEERPAAGWEESFAQAGADVVCTATGEVVPWATWKPSAPKGASVRGCKPEQVVAALQGRVGDGGIAALLEEAVR